MENEQSKDDQIKVMVFQKIHSTKLPNDVKYLFCHFMLLFPLNEKQTILFLTNLESKGAVISYLYRHLIRNAFKIGIPKTYIGEYLKAKEYYKKYYKRSKGADSSVKYEMEMRRMSRKLLQATIDMYMFRNSRKEKIKHLKEMINDEKTES